MASYTLDGFLGELVYHDDKINYVSRLFSELGRSEIESMHPLSPEDTLPVWDLQHRVESTFSSGAIDILYSLLPEALLLEKQSIGDTFEQGKKNFQEAAKAHVTIGDMIGYCDSRFEETGMSPDGRNMVEGLLHTVFSFMSARLKPEYCSKGSGFAVPSYSDDEDISSYLARLPDVYDLGMILVQHKMMVSMFKHLDSDQGKEEFPLFHGFKERGENETGFTLMTEDGASFTLDPGALFFYPYDHEGNPLPAKQYFEEMRLLYERGLSTSSSAMVPDIMHQKYEDNHGGALVSFTHQNTMMSVLAYHMLSLLSCDASYQDR
jgi:hypothetical protein